MSDKQNLFDKLKGKLSNLFGESPTSQQPDAAPQPAASGPTLNALEVMAVIINFARGQCGDDYKPEIEVESIFVVGPTPEQSGSRQMIEWFMSNRPGLALLVMPQPGSCSVTLAHGPNPPTKGTGYLLGLSPLDSQTIPGTINALRAQLEDYVKQGIIAWRDGKWHLEKTG